MFMDKILIFDQVKRLITAIAYGNLTDGVSSQKAYEIACEQIKELQDLMASPLKPIKSLKWNETSNRSLDLKCNISKINLKIMLKRQRNLLKKEIFFSWF